MLQLGVYHDLTILKLTDFGLYLGEEGDEVLLPNKYVPASYTFGDTIRVFVYLDSLDRIVATTIEPLVSLGHFAYLKVVHVSEHGAFMDWGLEKQLFVPFREQAIKMNEGESYVIYCYVDEKTNRLIASSRLNKFLSNEQLDIQRFDEVELLVTHESEIGVNVIINDKHKGLVYHSDIFKPLKIGERLTGTIKLIRPDNKIDVSLTPIGYKNIEPNAAIVMEYILKNKGRIYLFDKSAPEEIYDALGMSKKNFKIAVGSLYKQKLIQLLEDGIELLDKSKL